VIDWSRVQELKLEIGPDDFEEVVSLFLEEADQTVGSLTSLTEAVSMQHSLHFLKGSALNLGFTELAHLCQEEERRAASGNTDIAMDAVATVYQRSRVEFLTGTKIMAA
jgi:histidine phosphotransfer protein HptB